MIHIPYKCLIYINLFRTNCTVHFQSVQYVQIWSTHLTSKNKLILAPSQTEKNCYYRMSGYNILHNCSYTLVLDKRGMMRRVHNSPVMGWQVAKNKLQVSSATAAVWSWPRYAAGTWSSIKIAYCTVRWKLLNVHHPEKITATILAQLLWKYGALPDKFSFKSINVCSKCLTYNCACIYRLTVTDCPGRQTEEFRLLHFEFPNKSNRSSIHVLRIEWKERINRW